MLSDIKETCCQLIGAKRVEDVIVIGPEHVNQRIEALSHLLKNGNRSQVAYMPVLEFR